ncbi:hypothetical protein HG437_004175 [Candidatus Saccharibacteria bacterium]|nr:hypothetical protein [Candidatus Saccharibacteria bacterium]
MNKSIDQQPPHHEYASTRIEVAIKEDNKLHRKFKLALRDEKKSKHEKDTYMRAKSIIKNDQQEALEELVQTGERSTVPPGVLQRYQEERAICEATLAAIAEEERQSMEEDGGYEAEDEVMEAATHLGYAPLMPDEAAEQANEIYNATPLGKDVQQRRQIVKDRIGEINAELAYYMGLAEPPLAVISEETAIRIWGNEAFVKTQSAGEVGEPGYIDVFPDDDRTSRSGNKLGYGSRMTPEFIKKDASQRLAEVLAESAGEIWTVQELGDAIYDPSKVQTKLERYKRASILLYSAQRSDRPVMIITEELEYSGLVLQRGQRYTIDEHGRRRKSITVYRAVPADIAMQGLTEEMPVGGRAKQQIRWTLYGTTAAAHEAANITRGEALPAAGSAENEASASSVPDIDDALAKRALEAVRAAADRQAAEAKEQQEALRAAEAALSAEVRAQIKQLVELAQPLIDSLRENSADDNADKQVFPIQDLPEMGSQYASQHDLEIFLNKARQVGIINKKQLRTRALPSAGEALVLILYAYDSQTMYDLVHNDAAKRVLQRKFQQAYENRAAQVVNGREGGASAAQENTTS